MTFLGDLEGAHSHLYTQQVLTDNHQTRTPKGDLPAGPAAEPVQSPRSISDLSRSVRKFPTGPQGTIGRTIREGYSAERCTVRRGGDANTNVSKVPCSAPVKLIRIR